MNDIHKRENIDELRKRLYARNVDPQQKQPSVPVAEQREVATDWNTAEPAPPAEPPEDQSAAGVTVPPKTKRRYRTFVILGSLLIFLSGAGLLIFSLLFSGSGISSENISVVVAGPASIGGGEELSLQVAVSNQNPVPIESAVLIVNYPTGSRSPEAGNQEIFEERIPIGQIGVSEVQNVPIDVLVFGEEGQEKSIAATIEYRVEGSNGTFFKKAAPLQFQITSTPIVLRVQNVERVAAGQLVTLAVSAQSNSTETLNNILIQANYPTGFVFDEANPAPVFGDNVWRIDSLAPNETKEFLITGTVRGLTDESFRILFDAGPADSSNQFRTSSRLTEASADFVIERPFIDVNILINGQSGEVVAVPANKGSSVNIDLQNTLDETVYDMVVEVVPGGNALREESIKSLDGFYDSNSGTIRWTQSNNPSLAEVFPGDVRSLSFSIDPERNLTTASFDLVVNVYAKRLSETTAAEQLIGTTKALARLSSETFIGGQITHGLGQFADSGPLPPEVGSETSYTATIVVEAGANDMTDTVVSTSLPLYVEWLDNFQPAENVTYNAVAKRIEWRPGDIDAGEQAQFSFQVSFIPSISQIDTAPTLVNAQHLRAIDRFTGETLRSSASAITIALSEEAGFSPDDGRVVPQEN